jgi:Ca2+-binding RTX toxin-like protein
LHCVAFNAFGKGLGNHPKLPKGHTTATIFGATGDDTLDGDQNGSTLAGLGGNDTLNGSNGVDSLFGGTGDDSLTGEITTTICMAAMTGWRATADPTAYLVGSAQTALMGAKAKI